MKGAGLDIGFTPGPWSDRYLRAVHECRGNHIRFSDRSFCFNKVFENNQEELEIFGDSWRWLL